MYEKKETQERRELVENLLKVFGPWTGENDPAGTLTNCYLDEGSMTLNPHRVSAKEQFGCALLAEDILASEQKSLLINLVARAAARTDEILAAEKRKPSC